MLAQPGLRKTRLACVLNPFPTCSSCLPSNRRSRATAPLPLPHDPRPFVRSIAHEYGLESQRSAAPLYPRRSVTGSQGEKDERGPTEEDFCEAMQMVKAGAHEVLHVPAVYLAI